MSSGVRVGGYDSGGRRMSRRVGARAAGGGVSTNGAQRGSATCLRRPRLVEALRTARPYNRLSLRGPTIVNLPSEIPKWKNIFEANFKLILIYSNTKSVDSRKSRLGLNKSYLTAIGFLYNDSFYVMIFIR